MAIQDLLDQQVSKTAKMPIGAVVITNDTGSFKLPQGVRLLLRDCQDVTCTSNDGENELQFFNCNNVTVKDFTKGILRFEQCDEIREVTCNEEVTLNCSNGMFQGQVELTNVQGCFMDCNFQGETTFTGCELSSIQNTYEGELTLDGGRFHSDNDTFQAEVTSNGKGILTLNAPTFEADLTLDKDVVNLKDAQGKNITCDSTSLTDVQGQWDEGMFTGVDGVWGFRQTQFQKELQIQDGLASLLQVECQNEVTFQNASSSIRRGTFQNQVTVTEGSIAAADCTFQDQATFENCAANLLTCTFDSQITIQAGSLESRDCTFQDQYSYTGGGTVLSIKDTYQDQLTMQGMISANKVYQPETQGRCEFIGENAQSSLELTAIEAQEEVTFSNWGRLEILTGDTQNTTMDHCNLVQAGNLDCQRLEVNQCGTLNFDTCDFQEVTFNTCGTITLDLTDCTQITATDCGAILAGSANIQAGTFTDVDLAVTNGGQITQFTNGFLVDQNSQIQQSGNATMVINGSQVQQATGCLINSVGGNIQQALGCLVNSVGGTVVGMGGTVVTTTGGNIVNLPDGLTMGTNFNPFTSGGALMQAGQDLTLMSLGNMSIQSQFGHIDMRALLFVNINSLTTSINLNAPMQITLTASDIAMQALTGLINIQTLEVIGLNLSVVEHNLTITII